MIRTTYWTRRITDKRPDENDDLRENNKIPMGHSKNLVNDIEMTNMVDNSTKSTAKAPTSVFSSAFSSVFGLADQDTKAQNITKQLESQRRADTFDSLNQTTFEKIILNSNLVFILLVAASLFVVFSLPDEYSLFT